MKESYKKGEANPSWPLILRSPSRGVDRSVGRGYRWAGLLSFEKRLNRGAPRSNQDRDRLAKAQSHNANMHTPEESDCAVLPMNQSNKEEQSSAEVGEGRARAKENIVQSN